MHAAFWSVNFGLNVKPSREKKSIDFFKSLTATLTKIFLERVSTIGFSGDWVFSTVIVSLIGASSNMKFKGIDSPARQNSSVHARGPRELANDSTVSGKPKSGNNFSTSRNEFQWVIRSPSVSRMMRAQG